MDYVIYKKETRRIVMPEFSFQLKDDFLEQYKNIAPPFGFKDAGGNSLGELVFIRTYSRVKPDGTKEKW